jgi:hypothetical protein
VKSLSSEGKRLRDALIRSLRAEPLHIAAREGYLPAETGRLKHAFRSNLVDVLEAAATLGEGDELSYDSPEGAVSQGFQDAMRRALRGDTEITKSDAELFQELGFEKLSEFRSMLDTDLGGPAEIPEEDLAIYVSLEDKLAPGFKEALDQQFKELPEGLPPPAIEDQQLIEGPAEQVPTMDLLSEETITPTEDIPYMREIPPDIPVLPEAIDVEIGVPEEPERVEAVSLEIHAPETEVAPRKIISLQDLNPVPRLTAAMEAAGIDEDGFGFILRYGRYAPEGRRSDFIVGGLGLADLSNRIAAWLEGQAPMDAQVQIVDDGSGELLVYLLPQ